MQKEAVLYIFRTLVSIFRLEGQKILRVFFFWGLYFWEVLFWDLNFFDFFQKLRGYYDFTVPFPLNEEGPVHTILYTGTLGAKRAISFYANNLSR